VEDGIALLRLGFLNNNTCLFPYFTNFPARQKSNGGVPSGVATRSEASRKEVFKRGGVQHIALNMMSWYVFIKQPQSRVSILD